MMIVLAIYNRFRLVVAFPHPVSWIVLDNLEKSGAMDKHTAIVGLNSWPSACRSDYLQVPKLTLLSVRGFSFSEKCDTGAF